MNVRRRIGSALVGASLLVAVLAAPTAAASPAQFGGSFCRWFNTNGQGPTTQQPSRVGWWQNILEWLANFCEEQTPT